MLIESVFALTLACFASALDIKYSESDTLPLSFSCPPGSEKIDLHGLQGKYNGEFHNLPNTYGAYYAEVENAARAECASQYENVIPGSALSCIVTLNDFKAQNDFLIPPLDGFEKFEMVYMCPTPQNNKEAVELFEGTMMMSCPYGQFVDIVSSEDVEGQNIGDPSSFEADCNEFLQQEMTYDNAKSNYFCYVDGLGAASYQCQSTST